MINNELKIENGATATEEILENVQPQESTINNADDLIPKKEKLIYKNSRENCGGVWNVKRRIQIDIEFVRAIYLEKYILLRLLKN